MQYVQRSSQPFITVTYAAHLALRRARPRGQEARLGQIELGERERRRAGLHASHHVRQRRHVVRTDQHVDQVEALEQLGAVLLRHAAGDGDHDVVAPLLERAEAAERAQQLVLGLLAHAARVEHDQVGELGRVGRLVAFAVQHLGDAPRVVGVHLAAEGLYQEALHDRRAGAPAL